MTRLVLALAGLAACSTSLRAEDLSRDEFKRLSSLFSEAHTKFDENGALNDDMAKDLIGQQLEALKAWILRLRR